MAKHVFLGHRRNYAQNLPAQRFHQFFMTLFQPIRVVVEVAAVRLGVFEDCVVPVSLLEQHGLVEQQRSLLLLEFDGMLLEQFEAGKLEFADIPEFLEFFCSPVVVDDDEGIFSK